MPQYTFLDQKGTVNISIKRKKLLCFMNNLSQKEASSTFKLKSNKGANLLNLKEKVVKSIEKSNAGSKLSQNFMNIEVNI